jgi:NADH:ubiquinone oxidoreductase subunit F (NADH-binding)/ferredoxin
VVGLPEVVHCGPPRLTAGLDAYGRLDLAAHRDIHGDEPPPVDADDLVELCHLVNLRGRGGAGFPFAIKLRAVLHSAARRGVPSVLVVNGTEGEPGSRKDQALLARAPHLALDGAAAAAAAIDASEILVAVTDSVHAAPSVLAALAERTMPVPTRVVGVPHRFITGEAGALIQAINGFAAIPPGTKRYSSDAGVGGLPTLLSNVETFAQLAVAVRLGPLSYRAVGTPDEPGTVLLSVGGAVQRPCVVEAPAGAGLAGVLAAAGAAPDASVLIGGFHGAWLPPEHTARATLSRAGLARIGGTFGAGVVLTVGADTCPLGESARVVQYLAGEAAGQCGPCRRGLPELARALLALAGGAAEPRELDTIRQVAGATKGRGACGHPDGTIRFVRSTLDAFAKDVAAHLAGGGCGRPVAGVLPVPGMEGAGRLAVDWSRCEGHGLCGHLIPELIRLDAHGYPSFPDAPVPSWLEPAVRKAVAMCPTLALRLVEHQPSTNSGPMPRRH